MVLSIIVINHSSLMYVIDNYYKLLSRVVLKSIKGAKKLIQADESNEVSTNIHF